MRQVMGSAGAHPASVWHCCLLHRAPCCSPRQPLICAAFWPTTRDLQASCWGWSSAAWRCPQPRCALPTPTAATARCAAGQGQAVQSIMLHCAWRFPLHKHTLARCACRDPHSLPLTPPTTPLPPPPPAVQLPRGPARHGCLCARPRRARQLRGAALLLQGGRGHEGERGLWVGGQLGSTLWVFELAVSVKAGLVAVSSIDSRWPALPPLTCCCRHCHPPHRRRKRPRWARLSGCTRRPARSSVRGAPTAPAKCWTRPRPPRWTASRWRAAQRCPWPILGGGRRPAAWIPCWLLWRLWREPRRPSVSGGCSDSGRGA